MSWTDLFIKKNESTSTESSDDKSVKTTKDTLTPINQVTNNAPVNQTNQANFQTVGVDQNLVQKLQEIFDQANQPGPDLHEFITSVKKLEGKPLDERTKFETVFDIQSSSGLTKQRLLDSGKFYIDTFTDVKNEFEKEYQTELQNKVGNLNVQADNLISENGNLQKQIEEINKKISENLTKMQQLRNEASSNENKLMQDKMTFENTYSTFVGNVQKYIDNINLYIK
jgi:hypothetical protein